MDEHLCTVLPGKVKGKTYALLGQFTLFLIHSAPFELEYLHKEICYVVRYGTSWKAKLLARNLTPI